MKKHLKKSSNLFTSTCCDLCGKPYVDQNTYYKHFVVKHQWNSLHQHMRITAGNGTKKSVRKQYGRKCKDPMRLRVIGTLSVFSKHYSPPSDNKKSCTNNEPSRNKLPLLTEAAAQNFLSTGDFSVSASCPKSTVYLCKICDLNFDRKNKYLEHVSGHDTCRQFACGQCNYRFKTGQALKAHSQTHKNEKLHKCYICGRCFTHGSSLSNHLQRHSSEAKYQCQVCSKRFVVKGNLRTHQKIHASEKSFTCVTCGLSFSRSSNYHRHLKTHTGEKPYACKHCGKRFARAEKCVEHERVHTNEKPYLCTECDASFSDSGNFSKHKKNHTLGKVSKRKAQEEFLSDVENRRETPQATSVIRTVISAMNDTMAFDKENGQKESGGKMEQKKDEESSLAIVINLVRPPVKRTTPANSIATNVEISTTSVELNPVGNETEDTSYTHLTHLDSHVDALKMHDNSLIETNSLDGFSTANHYDVELNSLNNQAFFMLDHFPRENSLSFSSDGHLMLKGSSTLFLPGTENSFAPDRSFYGMSTNSGDINLNSHGDSQEMSSLHKTPLSSTYGFIPLTPNQEPEKTMAALDTSTFLNDEYFLKKDKNIKITELRL